MQLQDATARHVTLEECLDEINDFFATLDRYPPAMLAMAMRTHLECLLQVLLEGGLCTRQQVMEFVRELEEEVLERSDD